MKMYDENVSEQGHLVVSFHLQAVSKCIQLPLVYTL